MAPYKKPGVYIKEIPLIPPSVAQVETAIPAFIGYTEKGPEKPVRIKSMVEYRAIFGGPSKELPHFTITGSGKISSDPIPVTPVYKMYYMLELFFANGGGPCYIISVGSYHETPMVDAAALSGALDILKKEDEPTLILFPDAQSISDSTDYHNLFVDAMSQCADLRDRFTICDVQPADSSASNPVGDAFSEFRNKIGTNHLMYGAAYFPNLKTSLTHQFSEDEITIVNDGKTMVLRHSDATISDDDSKTGESLFHVNNGTNRQKYYDIRKMIDSVKLVLPPGGAVAGVYTMVDKNRGVWKSPANVSLHRVIAPVLSIGRADQEGMNVHSTGKSINAIRFFSGKGVLIWGARTLAGNDNEWRYISVRRFFNMVEESVKKATDPFELEPNDSNTWVKVKSMIENFLIKLWRDGALAGAQPEEAFFVKVGLRETMTERDIDNGKMIVEIGMAAIRPAEFIILRFSKKMIES